MKYFRVLLVVGLLWPATSQAQAGCDVIWSGLTTEQAQAEVAWLATEGGMLDERSGRISTARLAEFVLGYVHRNCVAQLAALGLNDAEFVSHTISRNFMTEAGTIPATIGVGALQRRLANFGWVTGLPSGGSVTAAPRPTATSSRPTAASTTYARPQQSRSPRAQQSITLRGIEIIE